VPILLYIGLLIGAQAFQETPKAHAVAVVFALIPNIASWASGLMTNAVLAAGSTPEKVGEQGFADNGLVFHGMALLGGGAILAGMILGAIVAFIIDKKFLPAAVYCFIGAALGFIGLIHAEKVGWNVGGQIALGYLFAGIVLLGFWLATRGRSESPSSESSSSESSPSSEADVASSEPAASTVAASSSEPESMPAPRAAEEPESASPAPSTA
jgi:AGZA family xanthine/uracil permease-like MFS transporter